MAARFPLREQVPADLELAGRWRSAAHGMYTFNIDRDAEGYKGTYHMGGCFEEPYITFTAIRLGDRVIVNFGHYELELRLATFESEVVLMYPFAWDEVHDGTFIDPRVVKDWRDHPLILRHTPAPSASVV
jgi:hypothetical protein